MRNKLLITAVLVFLTVFGVKAQQVNSGSPYSRYGIGNIEELKTGRTFAMGGIATGLRLPYEINPVNPASYSAIPNKIFLFHSGFNAERRNYITSGNKVDDYNFSLSSLNAAMSISKFWGLSFGMNPYSSVGYNISASDSVMNGDYVSHFNNRYSGEGGLTKIYLGNSFKYKGFSAGVNASYVFGPLIYRTESAQNEQGFSSYVFSLTDTKIKGLNLRYGIQYSDSLLKKYSFTAGAFYENITNLKATKTRYVSGTINPTSDYPIVDTLMNDTLINGIVQTPVTYGLGFSFYSPKIILGFDYRNSNWADVMFFNEKQENLVNSSLFAFGIEYTEDYMSKQFFKTLNWRVGGYLKNTELYLNNTQIKDAGVTFGVGIPTKSGAKINIGFQIGKKGTIENNLLQENYILMNFNISLTDRWFIRRRFF